MSAMPSSGVKLGISAGVWSRIRARFNQIIKRKAASDIALFFGLLLLLDLALPGSANLASVSPNPFWIPVLLVSVQHGSRAGLTAAIIAAALTILWVHPERDTLEDFYTYTTRLFVGPVLWIAAALILGQVRDRHVAEKAALESRAEDLVADRRLIGEHCIGLGQRIGVLERHISTLDEGSVGEALRRLADLRNAPAEHVTSRLEAAGTALLGPSMLSLHRWDGTEIRTEFITCGGLQAEPPRRSPGYRRALFNTMTDDPRVLFFSEPDDAHLLDGALVAVPLLDGDRETSDGVLVCEVLDPRSKFSERLAVIDLAMEALAGALTSALRRRISTRRFVSSELDARSA